MMHRKLFSEKTELQSSREISEVETTASSQEEFVGNQNYLEGIPHGFGLIGIGLTASILVIIFLRSFLVIANPNEVVILSGRKWKNNEGQEVGFRVLTGGRALRIPIVETIKRMDVRTMPVPIEVHNAYSNGGIPLHLQAIANIKISSDLHLVGNAIERFLDHKIEDIVRVARETLEGNLRGVVATMTPEQVNEDRLKFAERISSDISSDLAKLGLQLDTLKIQNVSDNVDYLKSLGRQRIAMIIRDAEIAESNALAAAKQVEAECQEKTKISLNQDQTTLIEKENELRKVIAMLQKEVTTELAITEATAKERKAAIEQKLQTLRAEREQLRLQSIEVLPAEAAFKAQTLLAEGKASEISENTLAEAYINELLFQVWHEIGKDASKMFIIQNFETIVKEASKIPELLDIKNTKIVDSGNGEAISSFIDIYFRSIKQFLEAVEDTFDIDVASTFKSIPESLTNT